MARSNNTKLHSAEKIAEKATGKETGNGSEKETEKADGQGADVFKLRHGEPSSAAEAQVHLLGKGIICDTEPRGHATPRGRNPFELVLDASEGFIALWEPNTTLRWRFRERSLQNFENPAAAKREIRKLFGEALLAWGTAAPIKFTEDDDVWDFELVMRSGDECNTSGCVLASSFFPDKGRHKFLMFPKLFTQSREEQVETFIHEIGHIFGLRHFFALVEEEAWPAQIFGTHDKFTIMNYGVLSMLTSTDKDDLRRLYESAWAGELTEINGTPVQLVKPYHTVVAERDKMVSVDGSPLSGGPRRWPVLAGR